MTRDSKPGNRFSPKPSGSLATSFAALDRRYIIHYVKKARRAESDSRILFEIEILK